MAARPAPTTHVGQVLHTEGITPHMQRVVLGGPGLDSFTAGEFTDHYVKLQFPRPDVEYSDPFDLGRIRAELPRDQWPVSRTYTARHWNATTRELTLDFVVHGDSGLAGPWAAATQPGERIALLGPGGGYRPEADADWHLLAGDESALPAIATSLEALPAGARAHVFVEVEGPDEEQKIDAAAEVVWLHRGERPVGAALVEAVRALDFPSGVPQAFVHGEAGFVKELRRLLRMEHGVPRERLSVSGYWRLGHDEDGWQSAKPEWNAQVEAEQERSA